MIYFFDRDMELKKLVVSSNVYNPTHQQVKNGMILAQLEFDIDYAFMFIDKVEYFGYYYNETFYLHRIKTVEPDFAENIMTVAGNHIFFDDMIGYNYIKDKRPVDRDAFFVLNDTIGEVTRWQIVMTDVTERLSSSFYYLTPMEALEQIVKDYQVEYEPRILFDGKKINGYLLHVANKLGNQDAKRVRFGDKVLSLKYDIDYSDISTAIIGRGKGEEVGDGYGRRIEFTDISFSRNGVVSPIGKNYMEDTRITDLYGYDDGTPKYEIVTFEDIENVNELAEATYNYYVENSKPKMLFETEVTDIGIKHIGDSLLIVKPENNLVFKVRVEKIDVDLHNPEAPTMELGDYEYFQESKVERRNREKNDQLHKRNQSLIERAKRDFDERFNAVVEQFRSEFEQAKIDVFAEIEADRVRMEALLDTKLDEFDTAFNADMEAAYEDAQRNYLEIENYVNTTVDTNREQVEQIINDTEQYAKDYAEQQAQEKANAVRTDLEAVTSGHQAMLEDLEYNVLDIDEYLGTARNITLDQRLLDMTQTFDERIKNTSRSASNMIRGSRFDERSLYNPAFTGTSVVTTEDINFVRFNTIQGGLPVIIMQGEVHLNSGVEYHLHLEYRTDNVTELDGFVFYHNDGRTERLENKGLFIDNLETTGRWEHASLTLNPTEDMSGRLALGTRRSFGTSPDGIIDVRLPYLTATAHDQWLPHPLDANQNIEEISRRITQLEDGYSDFIVRSVWDSEMNMLNQTIRSYQTTVDGVQDTIIQLQDSEVITRGREVIDTVDGFSRKVWLGDIDRPNMIPHSVFGSVETRNEWRAWGRYGSTYGGTFRDYAIMGDRDSAGNIGIISPDIGDYIETGKQYTLTWEASAHYPQTTSIHFQYMHLLNIGDTNYSHSLPNPEFEQISTGTNVVYRKYKLTFTAPANINPNTRILFGTHTMESNINAFFRFRHPKLEEGAVASPFKTSFSMIEQRADEISLAVQDIDLNGMLTQSDIRIESGYVQLGSQRLGDSQLASIFRVSPNSINAITDRMILNGDLLVKGDVTAAAVDAIEGNFARLFSAQVTAGTIHADYIEGFSARFLSLYILNANIERLVSQNVFTNAVTTKSLNAIEANIGRVRTAFLKSNVIESDHISVGTALVGKMFATSARIDQLITKNHFVTNVKAMSIEAVEGQFSSLITKYLSANYIDVNYVNGKNAWFETQYTKNANISKLTAQTAFIRDIQAIEITANQLSINTLHSKLRGTEGGLTIYGPDGRQLINNSMLRASFDVQIRPSHASGQVQFTGINYATSSDVWQTFEYFYTDYKGSKLLVSWAVDFYGPSASEYAEVRVRAFGGSSNPIRTSNKRIFTDGSTAYLNHIIDLGVPDYRTVQAYLEFRRSPTGSSSQNTIRARVLRVSMID